MARTQGELGECAFGTFERFLRKSLGQLQIGHTSKEIAYV